MQPTYSLGYDWPLKSIPCSLSAETEGDNLCQEPKQLFPECVKEPGHCFSGSLGGWSEATGTSQPAAHGCGDLQADFTEANLWVQSPYNPVK